MEYYKKTSPLIGYYHAKGALQSIDGLGAIDEVAVSIGAIVVFIMKGPAYEADPYPIPHNERNRL